MLMFNAQSPSEFIVEEILPDGTVLEVGKKLDLGRPEDQALERDYFTHFILQKTDWNTMQALGAISHRMRVKPGRLNFAGTKDKNAVTVQRCSAFAIAPERLLPLKVKDVEILGAWKAKDKVTLGDLAGNRFKITLTQANCGQDVKAEDICRKVESFKGRMKNFFGRQRFGSLRGNTATVGKFMVASDYHAAAMEYIAGAGPEPENFAAARKQLREEATAGDAGAFSKALAYFPQPLRYERQMIQYLANHPTDFVGALRVLPRNLQLMFVHAFQSELFNAYIAENEGDFLCPSDALSFPDVEKATMGASCVASEADGGRPQWPCAHIIGYDTQVTESEKAFLEARGVSQESFKLKAMPELSAKGALRPSIVPLKDFQVLQDEPVQVQFSLPSGSYATVALDQLLA